MTIDDTLNNREKTHGPFKEQAKQAQGIKVAMSLGKLPACQREALEMIATKISRIVHGNYNEPDHWHDIAGYATLIEKELNADT